MYSKSKKSKRRHILQLDYDDESSRSTPSPNSIQTNGVRVSPTPPSEPPKPALDDEFANFMAEIDAMPINEEMSQPPPPKEPEKPPEQPIEEVEETFDMIEPICQWQQCLDENTQCYYYWHMTTNDVKWEMPAEFSQHLLRHREYEEALAAFEARKQARETQKALIQPPPPPPPEEEEEEEKEKTDEPVPSTQQGRNFLWFMRDHEREEKEKQEEKKRAYAKKFVKGKSLDEEKNDLAIEAPRTDNREEMLNKLSGHSKAMLQGKGKSKFLERIGAYRHSNGNSPVNTSADEAEKETVDEEEEEDEMALLLELQEKQAELLALEMEVCGSGSDSEPPPPESEPHVPPPPPPEEEPPLPPEPEPEPPSKKPRLEEKKAEKPKKPPEGKKPIEPKNESFVPKEGSLAVTEEQAEIEDLSSTLTSRLECMQITRDTMSKMQILLIEIQTRIVDWVAGALTTSHLLIKLREADKQVKEYETIATPPGWTCHFDRYDPSIIVRAS